MLIVTLVCLAIASMLTFAIVRAAIQIQRQLLREEESVQVEWLARGALDRAWMRLEQNPDYTGETWDLTADDLARDATALVAIEIVIDPADTGTREARVTVDFAPNTPRAIRRMRSTRWNSTPETTVTPKES